MITTFEHLPTIRNAVTEGGSLVFVGGSFDIVHRGHQEQIEFAREEADRENLIGIVVVGVVCDESVFARKGFGRPYRKEDERLEFVDGMKGVDFSLIMPRLEPGNLSPTIQTIDRLRPNIFAIHAEQEHRRIKDMPMLEEMGVDIAINYAPKVVSTTEIAESIVQRATLIGA